MERTLMKTNYLERKRQAILDMGYTYVRFRSRAKKSLRTLKRIMQNNIGHFECHIERS